MSLYVFKSSAAQKRGETSVTKCNTALNHVNNYHGHSGSNDEIKTVLYALQAVQGQLSEVQQDIRESSRQQKKTKQVRALTLQVLTVFVSCAVEII